MPAARTTAQESGARAEVGAFVEIAGVRQGAGIDEYQQHKQTRHT